MISIERRLKERARERATCIGGGSGGEEARDGAPRKQQQLTLHGNNETWRQQQQQPLSSTLVFSVAAASSRFPLCLSFSLPFFAIISHLISLCPPTSFSGAKRYRSRFCIVCCLFSSFLSLARRAYTCLEQDLLCQSTLNTGLVCRVKNDVPSAIAPCHVCAPRSHAALPASLSLPPSLSSSSQQHSCASHSGCFRDQRGCARLNESTSLVTRE